MSDLLAIRRPLVLADHQRLRSHIGEVNRRFPHTQIKWRRLGEVGLSIVERGQYLVASEQAGSKLPGVGAKAVAKALNEQILPRMPTEHDKLQGRVLGCDFMGTGSIVSVSYLLDPKPHVAERQRLTRVLDRLGGINAFWGKEDDHVHHVSVATIDALSANQQVLDSFAGFAPSIFSLLPVKAFPDR